MPPCTRMIAPTNWPRQKFVPNVGLTDNPNLGTTVFIETAIKPPMRTHPNEIFDRS